MDHSGGDHVSGNSELLLKREIIRTKENLFGTKKKLTHKQDIRVSGDVYNGTLMDNDTLMDKLITLMYNDTLIVH